jgi:IclR family pca regulon transcriptional regulator
MPRVNPDAPRGSWSTPALNAPRFSQSLARGLAVLRCFTPERPVLGIADIADDLQMSRSTTHRYVITLVALGFLEQGASRKYRLSLRGTALEDLRNQTSCTVSLAVLNKADIVYVDRVRSLRQGLDEFDHDLGPGSHLPAYATAMGKLLLAQLPEKDLHELIEDMKLTKRGPNTVTRKRKLLTELDLIRQENFAVNDQELAADLSAIAAPIRDESGQVIAAISLAAHSSTISLEELIEVLGPQLVSTAERL